MIQVLDRGFKVLEQLAESPERAFSVGELAELIGVTSGTCFHIIRSLVELGYAQNMGSRRGYRLGPAANILKNNGGFHHKLCAVAEPLLSEFAALTGETTMLAVIQIPRRYELLRVEGDLPPNRIVAAPYNDVLVTATGRLLASYMDESQIEALIGQIGYPENGALNDVATIDEMNRRLAAIRKDEKIICEAGSDFNAQMAFPIREKGEVIAAIGCFVPHSRFVDEHRQKVIGALESTASAICDKIAGNDRYTA